MDSLADGKAFFSDPECEQLKDASGGYLEGPLYVGPHADNYTLMQDGTYKCGCGRVCETCDHTKVNMETGKCLCGKVQVYEAKIGDTGYTTLWDAMDAAQEMQNACTVTLLCDVTFSKPYTMDKGTVRLDLNGNSFRSDEGFDINGGSLTLQGGLMLTALQVNDGTLCIESGQYQGSLTRNGGEVILSGGTFMGGMKMQNMRRFPVADFLANGTAFYDDSVNPAELIDASSDSLTNYVTYSIRTHTDTYSSTTGKCPCGRTCKHTDGWTDGVCNTCGMICTHPNGYSSTDGKCEICGIECKHANVNMNTGICPDCQKQLYVAKIGDTGYATLGEALDAAQKMTNACTVTLLCDVSEKGKKITSGTITLNLNGKNLTIVRDQTVEIDGGDLTITSAAAGKMEFSGYGQIILRSGSLTVEGGEYESSGMDCIVVEGGNLKILAGTVRGHANALTLNAYLKVELSGGTFFPGDVGAIAGPSAAVELLAAGCAYYSDAEGNHIVDASGNTLSGTVYVLPKHPTHTFDAATCKCACGKDNHSINMDTGKCDVCQTQIYVAKIDTVGYKTLEEAIRAAEKIDGCTVTMLSDTEAIDNYHAWNLNITLNLNGKKITTENNLGYLTNGSGTVNIVDNSEEKTGQVGSWNHLLSLTTVGEGKIIVYGGRFLNFKVANNVTFYGGVLENAGLAQKLLDYLAPGRAAYSDAGGKKVLDASTLTGTLTGTYYILPHTDIYDPTIDKCPCGRKLLHPTWTAPTANTLTYDGTDQPLVTAGTAQNGRLLYSLEENGTYGTAVPTGRRIPIRSGTM